MTVEWGGDNRPVRWVDRLLGGGAEHTVPRSVNVLALTCAALAALALLATVLLPWAHVSAGSANSRLLGNDGNLLLEDVGSAATFCYFLGWLVLAIAIGLTLVAPAERRRPLVVGGLATAVFLAIMAASTAGRVINGNAWYADPSAGTSPRAGLYFGFVAVLLGATTLVLAAWQQSARRALVADELDEYEDAEFAPAPADLTVTSVPLTR